jgi:hypothetical protein
MCKYYYLFDSVNGEDGVGGGGGGAGKSNLIFYYSYAHANKCAHIYAQIYISFMSYPVLIGRW